MASVFEDIPVEFKGQVRESLHAWVNSLSEDEASTPVIHLLGASYTPADIKREVDEESEFGKQYLEGLFGLQERMKHLDENASIAALIRRSIKKQGAHGAQVAHGNQ